MKAVRFHRTGGPDLLVYEDVTDPTPKEGEVLIRVEAAGVNFADVMRRRGDDYPEPSPPPFILPTSNTIDLAERLPNSALKIYPDAGHGGIFQFHDEFVAQALAFLAS